MKRVAIRTLAVVVLLTAFLSARSAAQPFETPDFLEEIKLTARFQLGVQNIRHTLHPIERNNLQFLDAPVDPTVRYRAAPYYGMSAGLRWGDAELFGTVRTDGGFYPDGSFLGSGGDQIFYAESVALQGGARLQYFILDHVGAGLKYRETNITVSARHSQQVDGTRRRGFLLYRSKRRYRTLSFYVPLRYTIGPQVSLSGRVGLSLTVQPMKVSYDLAYAGLKRAPGGEEGQLAYDQSFTKQTQHTADQMNLQLGELGVTYHGLGVPLRLTLEIERIAAPDISELWKRGFNVHVGLPY